MQIFRSNQRGTTQADWLTSRHSFSFGNFYQDDRQGCSALRALNEVEIAPETGFPTHSHRDMEIITYVLSGELAYKDSEGNVVRLPAGDFQLMSAGSGIRQGEQNPLAARKLRFLQIWIVPNQMGLAPGYQQQRFARRTGLQLVASPRGDDGSLLIRQDARVYRLQLAADETSELRHVSGRQCYVHLVSGKVQLGAGEQETVLDAGDGAAVLAEEGLRFIAQEGGVEALVFDLPGS